MASQHDRWAEIAGVALISGDGVSVEPQPVIVVFHWDQWTVANGDGRDLPGDGESLDGGGEDLLQCVRSLGRIAEVAERKVAGQVGSGDVRGHG